MQSRYRIISIIALVAQTACVPALISDCFQSTPTSSSRTCDDRNCINGLFPIDLFNIAPETSRQVELTEGQYTIGVYVESLKDLNDLHIMNSPVLTIKLFESHGRLIRELPLKIAKEELDRSFAKRPNGAFLYAGQIVYIPPSSPNNNFKWASSKGFFENSNPQEPEWLKSCPIIECERTMKYCITVDKFIADESFRSVNAFVAVVK